MEIKTGVYICHCGENIAGTIDVERVTEYAAKLYSVAIARHYMFMCSEPGQELIKNDIKELGLNRVVVASCSPRMHELTFRNACLEGGLNPYLYEHVNIREHCSWVHRDRDRATEKAKDLVRAGVRRVYHHEPLEVKEAPVNPNTLVVGGGIAGISAALKIADSEHKVYLVEREPSVGGHMIQLDVTFPTLDCSECILTPKMTRVGSHPYIELMANSEVEDVSGYIGNFKVKIRKRARFVTDKCTACGDCIKGCPVEVFSEFEQGLAKRKAIYTPFPQAIPHEYIIDKKETPPCKLACPIHMDIQGYLALTSVGKFQEAYRLIRRTNPLPAVCGRVCYHPCEDACKRGYVDEPMAIACLKRFVADQIDIEGLEVPQITRNGKRVAVIGSGPTGLAAAHDLALLGYEVTIFEALPEPGGMLRVGIPDYRLPKDILKKDIEYIQRLGVDIKTDTRIGEQLTLKDLRRDYQAVFIAAGAHENLRLGIPGEESTGVIPALDFLRAVNMRQKVEIGERVGVIGGGNSAIDAARVARRLRASVTIIYRRSRIEMLANQAEVQAAEEEGVEFMFLAAPTRILAEDGRISKIECIRTTLGEPDVTGRRSPIPIEGSQFTVDFDAVIPALGQVPNLGFSEGLGLEVSSTGTLVADEANMATNAEGVFAGGDVVTGPAVVIEAIAAGKKAARSIDSYLKRETLAIEEGKAPERIGETEIAELKKRFPAQKRVEMPKLTPAKRIKAFKEIEQGYTIDQAQREAGRCLACGGCAECRECEKLCQAGAIDYGMKDEVVEAEVGSIIVATGYDAFDPSIITRYGYGKYDNVITALQFERLSSATGPTGGQILLKDGRKPESVAIIHCVGSRDQNYREYCSRVCCMYALKDAHLIREKTNAQVYQMYIDMRSFGEGYEEFYKRLSEEGIHFIRGKVAKVTDQALTEEERGKLIIICEHTLLGSMLRVPVDMVILCIALEPRSDAEQMARLFNINRRADGFFQETHLKLDPVATPTAGVFIVGCCEGPKDITDTVGQALAGASEALALIGKGRVTLEAAIAECDETLCIGCGRCKEVCEYHALTISKDGRASPVCVLNEVLCTGCGACAVACPTGAISIRHFTKDEILSMVDAFVEVVGDERF
jgi:heterodisulfide reductase subunit A